MISFRCEVLKIDDLLIHASHLISDLLMNLYHQCKHSFQMLFYISECSASINALIPNNVLPLDKSGGNFCAGPLTGERSPCVGDNGGPLVINNTLVGIASWGFSPCGYMGAPSIYTNIGNYVSWISLYVTDS